MRRTRVCIDCRYVGPRPSGIGEVTQALVDHLPVLAPDLDFLLLRHPAAPRLSEAPNVEEIVIRQAANGPATMWWLPRVVDLAWVDLFHAPFNIMPAGLAMPCVTTIHDVMWLTHPDWCDPRLKGRLDRHFYGHGIRRALRRAAAITTVSEASRREIAAIAPEAAARTHVTLSGVAADFRPVPQPADRADDRRFVLSVGQNAPYKNHAGALAAFARIAAARPDVDLEFMQRQASGAAAPLLAQAAALGLAARVRVLEPVPRDELVALYGGAAALLHPSLCEGFGNPLAEAMACGCPIVTSDRSAMPEVTGGAALLADPNDTGAVAAALARVLDEPDTAAAMRERGLARARELTWRSFAQATLAVYRSVLGGA